MNMVCHKCHAALHKGGEAVRCFLAGGWEEGGVGGGATGGGFYVVKPTFFWGGGGKEVETTVRNI
jgi:hypothetical protein